MSTNDPMTEKELDAIQVRADSVTTLRTASFNDWQELALHLSEDVDTLIAEVERLQARPAVTDDMVERAAREIYRPERWDEVRHSAFMKPGEIRAILEGPRARARRVLDAALGTGDPPATLDAPEHNDTEATP